MSDPKDNSHSDEIGCLEAIETLYAYLDGELAGGDSIAKVEQHLSHCESCYSRAELERKLTSHLRKSSRLEAPATLQGRLRKLLVKLDP
jgi:anti-sigma factor (TIGR02949 family)